MRLHYFDIPLDDLSIDEANIQALSFIKDSQQHYIVTPNPEMVVLATKDKSFLSALRAADLSLIDGVGLELAVWWLGGERPHRIPGSIFLSKFLENVGETAAVYFLGGEDGSAIDAAEKVNTQFKTNVVGLCEPTRGIYDVTADIRVLNLEKHTNIISAIKLAGPKILVVALGHNLQEKWMHEFLRDCPSVKVAIGVGGAIDYLSGRARQAPASWRSLGFEWLWRLWQQPWRFKRIFTATVVFGWRALTWWWGQKFLYRPSVVGCVLNKKNQVLIVARIDDTNHWQLPQGGIELGEELETAALREMAEELGTDKFKVLGRSKLNVHRYSWKKRANLYNNEASQRRYGYKGQRQTIVFLEFTGQDSAIKLEAAELSSWKWVDLENLQSSLHSVRRPLLEHIYKFIHDYRQQN
jgi:N-acetylglucosaminyldiphosphoundecaprenol N-acetyl-beta-D-mannosaminyltransferase